MADLNFAGSYDGLHLPYSPEAEQAVLGAIILESDTFDKVVDTIVRQFPMPRSMRRLLRKSTMFADLLRRPEKLLMTQLQATMIPRF